MGLVKHELSLLNLLLTPVELDKANQGELKAYNKEINTLLERTETEDEEESEKENESVTKGKARSSPKRELEMASKSIIARTKSMKNNQKHRSPTQIICC